VHVDAHDAVARWVDEPLVRGAEPRRQLLGFGLAAAGADRVASAFGGLGSVALPLQERDRDPAGAEEQQPDRSDRDAQRAQRQQAEDEQRRGAEPDEPADDVEGEHRRAARSAGYSERGCAAFASGTRTTAVPYATISDIAPPISELSNRIE